MQMPVIKKLANGSNQFMLIDLSEIVYIKIENRSIVYHTLNERYYHISTLSDLEEHLLDYGFDLLDKTNLVNMNKVKKLDQQHGNIYFEEEPNKASKFASIALIKQKLFKEEIAKAIYNNTIGKQDTLPAEDDNKASTKTEKKNA